MCLALVLKEWLYSNSRFSENLVTPSTEIQEVNIGSENISNCLEFLEIENK